MKLAAHALDYPRLVLLGTVIACVFGIYAVMVLPVERTPRIVIPLINVIVPNIGAAPLTNEAEITREIEEVAGTLDDLDYVISQSSQGNAVVSFVFLESIDVKEAKRDVQNLVDQVRPEFPDDTKEPLIQDVSFQDWPVIQVVIRGGPNLRILRQVAEDVQDRLEGLTGVAGVDLFGGLEREVQIQLDPNRMNLYQLTYQDVADVVASANTELPTGSIDTDSELEYRVRFRGKYLNVDAIRETPVATRDGRVILLRDVADVLDTHKRVTSYADSAAEPCVALLVRSQTDINTLDVVNRVNAIVKEERQRLGRGYHLHVVADQGREIRLMLGQLGTSAAYGFVLVLVILALAMGFRNSVLISFAMPFSLLVAAAIMLTMKKTVDEDLSVNNMVLFSVILVTGMVVDGALIVGENIYRHIEEGRSSFEAAKIGVTEVGPAVIAADLTTISAFVPMLMVNGTMGQFLRVMPITVAFALSGSMLVDHFVLPMMSRFFMHRPRKAPLPTAEQMHNLDTSSLPAEDHRATHVVYWKLMTYCLHHRSVVLLGSAATVVLAVAIFELGLIGYEFFPPSDIPELNIEYELPLGTGVERTRHIARVLEEPAFELYRRGELHSPPLTVVGRPGALSIRLNKRVRTGPEFGQIHLELVDARERQRSSQEIERWLREKLPNIPDVRWEIHAATEGPPVGSDILIRISGRKNTSLDDLGRIAGRVERMLTEIPGTENVSSSYQLRPETAVIPHPQIASLFGVDNRMVARSTQFALSGVEITEVDFGGQEDIDVRILNQPMHRNELKDLRLLPLRTPSGRYVTLDQVAEVKQTLGPNSILHRDENRVVRVLCDIDSDITLVDDVFDQLRRRITKLREQGDPDFNREDISLFYGGENEERDKSMADLQRAMFVGVALILIILVSQFNSFAQPLIIMLSIPLSFVGVIYGLMFCGYNFSIASMIGCVALTGIVVNDAIVLVDFINKLRDRGMTVEQAVIRAGQLRLRPIFLTTITTIGGLLPMALNISGGAEFFQPLTVSIMFGLAFATTLTLVVIPTAYYVHVQWFDALVNKVRSWRGGADEIAGS